MKAKILAIFIKGIEQQIGELELQTIVREVQVGIHETRKRLIAIAEERNEQSKIPG
jgi:hypothetical protein